jgi:small-conductance mechanosensitive channel
MATRPGHAAGDNVKTGGRAAPFVANGTVNETAALQSCTNAAECWLQDNAFVARLLATLLILIAGWLLVKITERALVRSARRLARMRKMDDQMTKALVGRTRPMRLVTALLVFVVSTIIITAIWGLTEVFTGLLAGAGFMGIVIGLAAADTIGDIVAGFLIFYNHPFDIGDWVDIDGTEGIIEDVALGATTLITWDNEKVTIPNRLVEGTKVKNYSHARKLRRRLVVGVEYTSAWP